MDKNIAKKIENEYFEYKGQRYHAGAKFTMHKQKGYDTWRIVEGTFLGYANGDKDKYHVMYIDKNSNRLAGVKTIVIVKREEMENVVIDMVPGNHYVERETKKRYCKDSDIPELVVGWPIYIFLMALNTIFNKRIGGWILLTVLFFVWRHRLKTKEYYYYEQ